VAASRELNGAIVLSQTRDYAVPRQLQQISVLSRGFGAGGAKVKMCLFPGSLSSEARIVVAAEPLLVGILLASDAR
jgi:hypothetical protein